MRIGINCRLLAPHSGGMKQYLFRLVNRLLESPEDECVLFYWPHHRALFEESLGPTWSAHAIEITSMRDLEPLLPTLDVYFCPFGLLEPRPATVASAVMLPDVQEAYLPQSFGMRERWSRLYHHGVSTRIAHRVLTLSAFSKACISAAYGVPDEKIHVAYQSASMADGIEGVDTAKHFAALPSRFVFYPANFWPHKNHAKLFAALAWARDRCGVTIPCVLTGADVPHGYVPDADIAQHGLSNQVQRLPYQPEAAMPVLYRRATALVFPSRFEGFGLPMTEAMSAGCPIVCSGTTSLPEVGGDAALYFDPESVEDMATALVRIWNDDGERTALARRGRERAAIFSLEAMVAAHREAFAAARRDFARSAPEPEPFQRRLFDFGLSGWKALSARVPPATPRQSWS